MIDKLKASIKNDTYSTINRASLRRPLIIKLKQALMHIYINHLTIYINQGKFVFETFISSMDHLLSKNSYLEYCQVIAFQTMPSKEKSSKKVIVFLSESMY